MMMADLLCIEGAHYQCNCQWHANDARSIGLNANSNWNISLQQPRLIIAVWGEWELSVTYMTCFGYHNWFFILHWLGTYVRAMCEVIELGVRVWIGALEGASIGWHSWWNVLWWWVWIGIVGVMTVSLCVCIISLPVLLHCCSLYEIELEQQWSDAGAWASLCASPIAGQFAVPDQEPQRWTGPTTSANNVTIRDRNRTLSRTFLDAPDERPKHCKLRLCHYK